MDCVGTPERLTELEYVHRLRDRPPTGCCGPLVTLPVIADRVHRLEEAFASPQASSLLWSGAIAEPDNFRLCAAHWMDLSYLCGMQGRRLHRRDWVGEAVVLLKQVARGAGWDPREMANMMMWQRVLLT